MCIGGKMILNYKVIGKRIQEIRLAKCLSQEKLAEMTNLSAGYISLIENNYREPSLETLVKLGNILGVTVRLCIGAWDGDTNALTANILKGAAKLIMSYESELKYDIFKEKVGRASVREITRMAAERKNGSLGYAEAMLTIYNSKRQKFALEWSKLYDTKNNKRQERNECSENETNVGSFV